MRILHEIGEKRGLKKGRPDMPPKIYDGLEFLAAVLTRQQGADSEATLLARH